MVGLCSRGQWLAGAWLDCIYGKCLVNTTRSLAPPLQVEISRNVHFAAVRGPFLIVTRKDRVEVRHK